VAVERNYALNNACKLQFQLSNSAFTNFCRFFLLNWPQEGEEQAGLEGLPAQKEGPTRGQQTQITRTSRRTP
jgi:hypothetical protein